MTLQLPCRLFDEGRASASEGITVDVTRQGALIECPPPPLSRRGPQEGDIVTVEIALPRGPAERRCFRGRARIVRLERSAAGVLRLAVEFSRLQFARWQPEPQAPAAGAGRYRMEAAV